VYSERSQMWRFFPHTSCNENKINVFPGDDIMKYCQMTRKPQGCFTRWLIMDVNSVLELLRHVVVEDVSNVFTTRYPHGRQRVP
jgi:hypothetical protein